MSDHLERVLELLDQPTQRSPEPAYPEGSMRPEVCWRCDWSSAVDELGLCVPCAEALRNPETVAPEPLDVHAWLERVVMPAPRPVARGGISYHRARVLSESERDEAGPIAFVLDSLRRISTCFMAVLGEPRRQGDRITPGDGRLSAAIERAAAAADSEGETWSVVVHTDGRVYLNDRLIAGAALADEDRIDSLRYAMENIRPRQRDERPWVSRRTASGSRIWTPGDRAPLPPIEDEPGMTYFRWTGNAEEWAATTVVPVEGDGSPPAWPIPWAPETWDVEESPPVSSIYVGIDVVAGPTPGDIVTEILSAHRDREILSAHLSVNPELLGVYEVVDPETVILDADGNVERIEAREVRFTRLRAETSE